MANMREVNNAIREAFPALDIVAVRGNGYIYFDGDDGFDKINSVYSHPLGTSTPVMTRLCINEIRDYIDKMVRN